LRKAFLLPLGVVTLLILGVGAAFSFYYFISPPSSDSTEVSITVTPGDSVTKISEKLSAAQVIRSSWAFRIFVRVAGFETKLQAGEFRIGKNLPLKEVVYHLARGTTDQRLTTIEGWRVEEIAEYLEKKKVISRDEFLEAAGKNVFNQDFLPAYQSNRDKPYRRLEGYLFPDTYFFAAQSSAEAIIKTMLQNFGARLTPPLRADTVKNKLSLAETMTLASIVEREVRRAEDRAIVAGILLKRYQTPGHRLEVDATVQYAIGGIGSWWPVLADSGRNIAPESPYNTYTHDGLPPTPISSPGLASIKAVIYPQASDYWYYVSDSLGVMHFAKTIEEQNANAAKYSR
jgi:UPF0755 protein